MDIPNGQELLTKATKTTQDVKQQANEAFKATTQRFGAIRNLGSKAMERVRPTPKNEKQSSLFRRASFFAGATALVGAGIKFGPEIIKHLPFGKSDAERKAEMRAEAEVYPPDTLVEAPESTGWPEDEMATSATAQTTTGYGIDQPDQVRPE